MDYKRNAKYFKPGLRISIKGWLVCIAIVAVLLAVKPLYGIGTLVLFALFLYGVYGGKPGDDVIDAAINELSQTIKADALRKLGLEEEEVSIAPPLFLKSYSYGTSVLGDAANMKCIDRPGKDGRLRSPEVVLTAWFFTEEQIYHYVKIASLVSDSKKELTDEFYYKDVVSVKTGTVEKPWIDPRTGKESTTKKFSATTFIIRTTGGESAEDACDRTEDAEAAVSAMRNLLKQKKLAQK